MATAVDQLARQAEDFKAELDLQKQQVASPDFPWYPYGSLDNFGLLEQLLADGDDPFVRAHPGPVVDIGAADGDTAFFLESRGFEVDVVDNGPTNFNGCRGLKRLIEARASKVRLLETDLDQQFRLPRDDYRLILFLGILYHLKNPWYALEQLAKHGSELLLSTRITRFNRAAENGHQADGVNPEQVDLAGVPAAYLVAPDECNNDATNFWIFTEAGLRRLLHRTGWEVVALSCFGAVGNSDPASPNGDERAFVYARRAG